ncbi:MAG: 3-phosphoshikimate 1-carboxyvinyltransferase [Acidimicrobiales bacterium]
MTGPRTVEPLTDRPDHVVTVPGSKSLTNRALLIAALAEGESRLTGCLFAEDTAAMVACIETMGARVDVDQATATILIGGTGGTVAAGPRSFTARQSGTTGRFVAAAVLAGQGRYQIDGDAQLRARPMTDLIRALESLGVGVDAPDGGFPLAVNVEQPVAGGPVEIDASRSSQFGSALMMVGPLLADGLDLGLNGEVVSRPYLDMTVELMRAFGAEIETRGNGYRISPGRYQGRAWAIEPDASAASYFFGAAAVTGGRVTVAGLSRDAWQGDVGFVDVLEAMGADVVDGEDGLTVRGRALHGVTVDMRDISDTVPTLAVVAATADGATTIEGVGFIRGKETDRIAAVVDELVKLGVEAEPRPDGLVIEPGSHHQGLVDTYDDHRIAMAFSLLGLHGPSVDIDAPDCVSKTFPDFFAVLDRLRSRPDESATEVEDSVSESELTVIAIDGPAGSGKSTVARAVAERLELEYLDTGAMYRAVTYAAICRGIDPAERDAVGEVAREMELTVDQAGVRVDGHDATTEIRGPEVTRAVSEVAANPDVRKELRSRQREWARRRGGGVMEGRDIGTVVFPDARLKVYLTAAPEVRAGRRAQEVSDLDYETVAADIARRDAFDQGRDDSPLIEADDAITIDTSLMSIDQVVDAVEAALQ